MSNDIKQINVTMCNTDTGEILFSYCKTYQFTKSIRTRLEDVVRSLNRGVVNGVNLSLVISVSSVRESLKLFPDVY